MKLRRFHCSISCNSQPVSIRITFFWTNEMTVELTASTHTFHSNWRGVFVANHSSSFISLQWAKKKSNGNRCYSTERYSQHVQKVRCFAFICERWSYFQPNHVLMAFFATRFRMRRQSMFFFFFFFLFRLLQKHTHFLIDVVSITSYVTCIFGLLFWTAFIILFSLFRHNVCLWQMCALICLVFHQRASNWAEENKFKLLSRFVSIAWLWTRQITPFAIFTHTATYSPDIIWPVCDDPYSNSIICLFVEFWISSMWSQSRMQNTSTILK